MMSPIDSCSSAGLRSISAFSGIAARSSARTLLSEPLTARPMGVRIASTITASGMWACLLGSAELYARSYGCARSGGRRLTAASQVQTADAQLVEAHVVGELVAHGAHDLLAELLWIMAEVPAKGVAEDDDAVVRAISRGAIALVHAVGALSAAAVGDHDGDVRERVAQQVGQVVERVAHELFEVRVIERVELHAVAFVGVQREPFSRDRLGVAHDPLH